VFLNHGSYGACPRAFIEEQRRWVDCLEEQPVLYFRELNGRMRKAREALAGFLGAQPENLVYVTNATYAVNLVAQALSKTIIGEGDEILATDQEYGACKRAWIEYAVNKGVKFVEAKIPIPSPPLGELVDIIWS
jgi:isopenicillin-N epimerase